MRVTFHAARSSRNFDWSWSFKKPHYPLSRFQTHLVQIRSELSFVLASRYQMWLLFVASSFRNNSALTDKNKNLINNSTSSLRHGTASSIKLTVISFSDVFVPVADPYLWVHKVVCSIIAALREHPHHKASVKTKRKPYHPALLVKIIFAVSSWNREN